MWTLGRFERRRAARAAALLAPAALGAILWLAVPRAGDWLVRPSHVSRCDVMVVLGGGARERLLSAVDLLADGACPALLLTGTSLVGNPAEVAARSLPPGFPAPRFIESASTLGDASGALAVARATGAKALLVVTSPYHTRRALWIFSRVFRRTGVEFGIFPSESFYFENRSWWTSRDGRAVVAEEYWKLFVSGLAADGLVLLNAAWSRAA